jgi:predicted dehydrogenase
MLEIGIIGYGHMGQIRAKALNKVQDCRIKYIFDYVDIKNKDFPIADSAESIFEDESIDALFICTVNSMNKDLVIKGLKNGKHVFCEKPPAFTADEVREIIAAEEKSGKKLMYGFNHRHHGAVIKMKSEIDTGNYGKVLWMRGRYGKSVDEGYFDTWRVNKDLAGGGILIDQGIHMLDLFNHMGGGFDQTHAFVSNLYWHLEGIEDNVFAIFKNSKTGVAASLHSTMTQWRHMFSLEVFLEGGYMVLNGLKTSSGTYGDEVLTVAKNRTKAPAATWDDEESYRFEIDSSWDNEVRHFIDAINNNTDVEIGTSHDALKVMGLIDEVYKNERHDSENLNRKLTSNK